ncbi:MAG: EpsG family protein [bacterium]
MSEYLGRENKVAVNGTTIFIILLLSILSGLRGEMGVDYHAYKNAFESIPSIYSYLFKGEGELFRLINYFEPLYIIIISIFKMFLSNYNIFLFVQSLILLLIVVRSVKMLDVPVNIGLIFYFFISYLDQFGQQRMAIIYVLCLFATTFIVQRKFLKFLFTIIIASFIQKIAIFYLPAYFLYIFLNKKTNSKSIITSTKNLFKRPILKKHYKGNIYEPEIIQLRVLTGIILLILSIFINIKYNIANLLLENIESFAMGNPIVNVYASNFISYYSKMEVERNIFGALGGISIYLLIISFLYIYRKRWFNINTVPIFLNFVFGVILFILLYDFPKLSGRIIDLYSYPAYVFIFGIIASQKEKPINTLPVIFLFIMYFFIRTIITETGPYVFLSF